MGGPEDGLAIIIPARYEASRFPGKLLQCVAGRSILEWTWRRAVSAAITSHIFIATDSDRISAEAMRFGADVIPTMLRIDKGREGVFRGDLQLWFDHGCFRFYDTQPQGDAPNLVRANKIDVDSRRSVEHLVAWQMRSTPAAPFHPSSF